MLPVKLGEPSLRWQLEDIHLNDEELRVELDTLEEWRGRATLRAEACKRMVERRYNTKVQPRSFQEGDLVWRKTGETRRTTSHRKLTAKWEWPFKVTKALRNEAYHLTNLDRSSIPNTLNASHLKFYFS